jgi:hypothetical protein
MPNLALLAGAGANMLANQCMKLFAYEQSFRMRRKVWGENNCWALAVVDALGSCLSLRACLEPSVPAFLDFTSKGSLLESLELFFRQNRRVECDTIKFGAESEFNTALECMLAQNNNFYQAVVVQSDIECTRCQRKYNVSGETFSDDMYNNNYYRKDMYEREEHYPLRYEFVVDKTLKLKGSADRYRCAECKATRFKVRVQYVPLRNFFANLYRQPARITIPLREEGYILRCVVFYSAAVNAKHFWSAVFDEERYVITNCNSEKVYDIKHDDKEFTFSSVWLTVYEINNNEVLRVCSACAGR